MHFAISGRSGLVGQALSRELSADGHSVHTIVRDGSSGLSWDASRSVVEWDESVAVDTVIHLAGEPSKGRWTSAKKNAIRDSRINFTRDLCNTLAGLDNPPATLVCASAIGYYGDTGSSIATENSPAGSDFLAEVAREWEAATEPAARAGIRVVNIRTAMVLSTQGGALAELLLPFRLGLGGPVGSGNQYWSWIGIQDMVGAIRFLADHQSISGPVNLAAPTAVTNRQFATTLAKVLGRPAVLPMPAFAARLLLGEMADAMLLSSVRVAPERLEDAGYVFRHRNLEAALADIIRDRL